MPRRQSTAEESNPLSSVRGRGRGSGSAPEPALDPDPEPEPPYRDGDRVLATDRCGDVYEASVLKWRTKPVAAPTDLAGDSSIASSPSSSSGPQRQEDNARRSRPTGDCHTDLLPQSLQHRWEFRVHFFGWSARYDEWVDERNVCPVRPWMGPALDEKKRMKKGKGGKGAAGRGPPVRGKIVDGDGYDNSGSYFEIDCVMGWRECIAMSENGTVKGKDEYLVSYRDCVEMRWEPESNLCESASVEARNFRRKCDRYNARIAAAAASVSSSSESRRESTSRGAGDGLCVPDVNDNVGGRVQAEQSGDKGRNQSRSRNLSLSRSQSTGRSQRTDRSQRAQAQRPATPTPSSSHASALARGGGVPSAPPPSSAPPFSSASTLASGGNASPSSSACRRGSVGGSGERGKTKAAARRQLEEEKSSLGCGSGSGSKEGAAGGSGTLLSGRLLVPAAPVTPSPQMIPNDDDGKNDERQTRWRKRRRRKRKQQGQKGFRLPASSDRGREQTLAPPSLQKRNAVESEIRGNNGRGGLCLSSHQPPVFSALMSDKVVSVREVANKSHPASAVAISKPFSSASFAGSGEALPLSSSGGNEGGLRPPSDGGQLRSLCNIRRGATVSSSNRDCARSRSPSGAGTATVIRAKEGHGEGGSHGRGRTVLGSLERVSGANEKGPRASWRGPAVPPQSSPPAALTGRSLSCLGQTGTSVDAAASLTEIELESNAGDANDGHSDDQEDEGQQETGDALATAVTAALLPLARRRSHSRSDDGHCGGSPAKRSPPGEKKASGEKVASLSQVELDDKSKSNGVICDHEERQVQQDKAFATAAAASSSLPTRRRRRRIYGRRESGGSSASPSGQRLAANGSNNTKALCVLKEASSSSAADIRVKTRVGGKSDFTCGLSRGCLLTAAGAPPTKACRSESTGDRRSRRRERRGDEAAPPLYAKERGAASAVAAARGRDMGAAAATQRGDTAEVGGNHAEPAKKLEVSRAGDSVRSSCNIANPTRIADCAVGTVARVSSRGVLIDGSTEGAIGRNEKAELHAVSGNVSSGDLDQNCPSERKRDAAMMVTPDPALADDGSGRGLQPALEGSIAAMPATKKAKLALHPPYQTSVASSSVVPSSAPLRGENDGAQSVKPFRGPLATEGGNLQPEPERLHITNPKAALPFVQPSGLAIVTPTFYQHGSKKREEVTLTQQTKERALVRDQEGEGVSAATRNECEEALVKICSVDFFFKSCSTTAKKMIEQGSASSVGMVDMLEMVSQQSIGKDLSQLRVALQNTEEQCMKRRTMNEILIGTGLGQKLATSTESQHRGSALVTCGGKVRRRKSLFSGMPAASLKDKIIGDPRWKAAGLVEKRTAMPSLLCTSKDEAVAPVTTNAGDCATTAAAVADTPVKLSTQQKPELIIHKEALDIGPGWRLEVYQRKCGKTKGHLDKYWYSPVLNKKFRSMKEVKLFMHALARVERNDEAIAWKLFKVCQKEDQCCATSVHRGDAMCTED